MRVPTKAERIVMHAAASNSPHLDWSEGDPHDADMTEIHERLEALGWLTHIITDSPRGEDWETVEWLLTESGRRALALAVMATLSESKAGGDAP